MLTSAPGAAAAAFSAIVLAGDRTAGDALRAHSGVNAKALIPIAGVPMVRRVLAALEAARQVADVRLAGPAEADLRGDAQLAAWVDSGALGWAPPAATPSTSACAALECIPRDRRVLLTTADHPLLSAEIVDAFCAASLAEDADVTLGLARHQLVRAAFPDMRKTVLRFRDGDYCGCNLFTFLTPRGREIAGFWRRIENQRKKPLRLIGLLGWRAVIRYRLGRLPLDEALAGLSARLGIHIRAVILPYAQAAVDVDSLDDFRLVEAGAAGVSGSGPGAAAR
ncbi:MAG: nucleotidyltransferase family protein [Pseudomonadota bacterium]